MVVELYPHQREAVESLGNGKVLWGGVGTGKTITSLVYFYEKVCGGTIGDLGSLKSPTDLYVITTAKKRDSFDWQEDAAKLSITGNSEASVGGIKLTVDSWNNIDKYSDVRDAFFIFDEQRVVGSGAWYKSFIKIAKSNRWLLLSATPGDTWLDYIALFVANGFVKNRTEFKRNHCVYSYYGRYPKLERYLETGKLVRWRNQLLVEMPYKRHTTRHIHDVPVDYDKDLWEMVVKKRWHVYEDRPLRDVSELFSVMRKVVNSDASRLQAVRELMNTHPKVIVFYNFDYELEELRKLGSVISEDSTRPAQRQKDVVTNVVEVPSLSTRLSGDSSNLQKPDPSHLEKSETPGANTNEQLLSNGVETIQTMDEATKRFGGDESWMKQKFDESSERRFRPTSSEGIAKSSSESSTTELDGSEKFHQPDPMTFEETTTQNPQSRKETILEQESSSGTLKSADTTSGFTSGMTGSGSEPTAQDAGWTSRKHQKDHTRAPATSKRSLVWSVEPSDAKSENEIDETSPKTWERREQSLSESSDLYSIGSGTGSKPFTSGGSFAVAEWNGHKHEPIPKTDRWVYLVQYVAGAEGWNCIDTDAMVFYSLTYSYKNFHQAQGRIDRLNTPFLDLHYYNLVSKSPIDRAISRALKEKRNFNESSYVKNF